MSTKDGVGDAREEDKDDGDEDKDEEEEEDEQEDEEPMPPALIADDNTKELLELGAAADEDGTGADLLSAYNAGGGALLGPPRRDANVLTKLFFNSPGGWTDEALHALLCAIHQWLCHEREDHYLFEPDRLCLNYYDLAPWETRATLETLTTSWAEAIGRVADIPCLPRPEEEARLLRAWRRALILGALFKAHTVRELFLAPNAAAANRLRLRPLPRASMTFFAALGPLIMGFEQHRDPVDFITRAKHQWVLGLPLDTASGVDGHDEDDDDPMV